MLSRPKFKTFLELVLTHLDKLKINSNPLLQAKGDHLNNRNTSS